jgi:hypothetical protein
MDSVTGVLSTAKTTKIRPELTLLRSLGWRLPERVSQTCPLLGPLGPVLTVNI